MCFIFLYSFSMWIDSYGIKHNIISNNDKVTDNLNFSNESTSTTNKALTIAVKNVKLVKENHLSSINVDESRLWNSSHWEKDIYDNNLSSHDSDTKSLECALINNEQYPLLIANISKEYSKHKDRDREVLQTRIKRRQETKIDKEEWEILSEEIPSFEEFLLENDTEENFNEFLKNDYADKVVLNNLRLLVDKEWNTHFDLVSEPDLTAEVKVAWRAKLLNDYYSKYPDLNKKSFSEELKKWEFIKHKIDYVVSRYLMKDNTTWLATQLDWVLNEIENDKSFSFEDEESRNIFLDNFGQFLRNCIREYYRLKDDKENDKKLNLQLKSYLYLYWKYFYKDKFKTHWWDLNSYEKDLNEILEAILYFNWDLDTLKKNKYLEYEKELLRAQEERQRIAREEAFKKNRERNNNLKSLSFDTWNLDVNWNRKNFDLQNASWVDIAQEEWLWKHLNQFKLKESSNESDTSILRNSAFYKVCENFLKRNEMVSKYLSIKDLQKLFVLWDDNMYFNQENWDKFKSSWIEKNGDSGDFDLIESSLKFSFPSEFKSSFEELLSFSNDKMWEIHETVKNHAIWAVIDNIKDIFDEICNKNVSWQYFEWFKYNESEPVKIIGDCMIISWYFRWEVMNISYNVNNWKLCINSCISKVWNDFSIWSTSPTQEIWIIKPFDDILKDFYNKPSESTVDWIYNIKWNWMKNKIEKKKESDRLKLQEICLTTIDKFWDKVTEEIDKKAKINTTVVSMLRTLNIFPWYKSVVFKPWTDLHEFIQIVQNSDKYGTLDYFLRFIPDFSKLLWLSWWKNNLKQNKTAADSKPLFEYKWDNETITYIRENSKNFDNEAEKKLAEFENPNNFWILKIINEKFTSWETVWEISRKKFDINKIDEVEHDLAELIIL